MLLSNCFSLKIVINYLFGLILLSLFGCKSEDLTHPQEQCSEYPFPLRYNSDDECSLLLRIGNFNDGSINNDFFGNLDSINSNFINKFNYSTKIFLDSISLTPFIDAVENNLEIYSAESKFIMPGLANIRIDTLNYFLNRNFLSSTSAVPEYTYINGTLGSISGDTITLVPDTRNLYPDFVKITQDNEYSAILSISGESISDQCFIFYPCVRYQ